MGGQKDARALSGDSLSGGYLEADDSDGIIPRAIRDIFDRKQEHEERQYTVQVQLSCLEIYQDELRDLLVPPTCGSLSPGPALQLRDHGDGVTVRGLTTVAVHSVDHVQRLLARAMERRTTAATRLNERSSRSHAVCTLWLTVAPPPSSSSSAARAGGTARQRQRAPVVKAKLTLVDLAGSERIKDTGVVGVQQQESININKDLFVLGKVVAALSERAKRSRGATAPGHVPYRDSKLTRLLRDSLGGNCRTCLLACVSPADLNVDESVNTLRYAERSRTIANVVKQNLIQAEISPSEHAALRAENKKLRLMVSQLKKALEAGEGSSSNRNSNSQRASTSKYDQVRGLQEKLQAAEREAKAARDMSLALVEQTTRYKEQLASANESQPRPSQSIVSPLLSYELSMGIAQNDEESLIDDNDSVWSVDDGLRSDSSAIQAEVSSLSKEKATLEEELRKLNEQIIAQQSHLIVLRTNVKVEQQKRQEFANEVNEVEAATQTAADLVVTDLENTLAAERRRGDELEKELADVRRMVELHKAEIDNLSQRNHNLQSEVEQLRVREREALEHEIRQVERQIEDFQRSKETKRSSIPAAVLQDSTADSNKACTVVNSGEVAKNRNALNNVEEEKKSEDPFLTENQNPLQILLDDMTTADSISRPFNDDESDIIPAPVHPSDGFDMIPSAGTKAKEVVDNSLNDIKMKAEEILNVAGQFFDNSSRSSVTGSTVSSVGTYFLPRNEPSASPKSDKIVISNIDVANQCTCEDSAFGGRAEHIDFYLPKLGIACTCGRGAPAATLEGDPLSLHNILRPWQCEFLASLDIHEAEEYICSYKDRGRAMAADMRRWRRKHNLLSVKTKSCLIALHIWSRTCQSVVRSIRQQQQNGIAKPERPDFLQISISRDARSVSTMGFGSVVENRAIL